jgi:hypothetical protein
MMDDNAIDAMNLILEYVPTLAVRFGPPCNVVVFAGDSGLLDQLTCPSQHYPTSQFTL